MPDAVMGTARDAGRYLLQFFRASEEHAKDLGQQGGLPLISSHLQEN